jgi:hypothetical protein
MQEKSGKNMPFALLYNSDATAIRQLCISATAHCDIGMPIKNIRRARRAFPDFIAWRKVKVLKFTPDSCGCRMINNSSESQEI